MPWFRQTGLALFFMCLSGAPSQAASDYTIDQRVGSIGFSVSQAHLFDVDGGFQRFSGKLFLDLEHPTQSHIDVAVEAASVTIPVPEGEAMLRSPAYFDPARFPTVHFQSQSIVENSDRNYTIRGILEMRGVSRPLVLTATLKDRIDPAHLPVIADFLASGEMDRTAFGMVANTDFVGNTVKLTIRLRLKLL
jgi:polyisoprenoid-binding protein YceI